MSPAFRSVLTFLDFHDKYDEPLKKWPKYQHSEKVKIGIAAPHSRDLSSSLLWTEFCYKETEGDVSIDNEAHSLFERNQLSVCVRLCVCASVCLKLCISGSDL